MSSKSDQVTHLQRRIAVLEEATRRLGTGVRALQTVALTYGGHRLACTATGAEPAACDCGWDSTRVTIEVGFTKATAQAEQAPEPSRLVTL